MLVFSPVNANSSLTYLIVCNSVWMCSRKSECIVTICNIVPNSLYNISFIMFMHGD